MKIKEGQWLHDPALFKQNESYIYIKKIKDQLLIPKAHIVVFENFYGKMQIVSDSEDISKLERLDVMYINEKRELISNLLEVKSIKVFSAEGLWK
jgi:hypothetical protein